MALFRWYGSGQGQWSGFPAYESTPTGFLFEYTTADLLAIIDARRMNRSEIAGVARFFADWDFGRRRPNDRKLISDKLCDLLLQTTLKGTNEDNKQRAMHAFKRPAN